MALLVISLASAILEHCDKQAFLDFCVFLLQEMWRVVTAGDKTPMLYAEKLVIHFHDFRVSEHLRDQWTFLIRSLDISSFGDLETDILLQHLLDEVLEVLISTRNARDLPLLEAFINEEKMEKGEEQVLAYVAGYVPFALRKHYNCIKNNSTAKKFVDILSAWACDGPFEKQYSFLEYTRDWITAQDRGKLFKPNPKVIIFFRALENETRKHLNTQIIAKYRDTSLRDTLLNYITKSFLIQQYWTQITTDDLSVAEKTKLFKAVVTYWINIRCRAFVIVYVDIRKLNETLSKKGEKSLRKQLSA